jgi:hypothetical protein
LADYLLLYAGGKMPESDEEQATVMKAWDEWFHQLGGTLKDGGNPFTPQAKTVGAGGEVSHGPAMGMASGYSIVTADSLDEAVDKAKGRSRSSGRRHEHRVRDVRGDVERRPQACVRSRPNSELSIIQKIANPPYRSTAATGSTNATSVIAR